MTTATDTIRLAPDYRDDPKFTELPVVCQYILADIKHAEERIRAEVERRFATAEQLINEMRLGITINGIYCHVWQTRVSVEVQKPERGTIQLKLDSVGPLVAPGYVTYDVIGWTPALTEEEIRRGIEERKELRGENWQWGLD